MRYWHARTTWAPGRRTTTTRSAGRTRWTRRSSGPSRSPRTTAARATGWSFPGPGTSRNGGGIRSQWHHTIDVVPTILEAAGLQQPAIVNGVAQKPIEGISMAYTFDQPTAPSARRTQYFEMMGNRAIYHDGWLACTTPMRPPWQQAEYTGDVITGYGWELYHVAEDFSQAVNLATKHPDKLQELQLLFYAEAAKYNVLPLDHSTLARVDVAVRPSLTRGRTEFTYSAGTTRIPEGAAPDVKNKSFRITADLVLAKSDENGVVVTQGGLFGGYALLFKAGRPVFHYNLLNVAHFEIAATDALTSGRHTVVLRLPVRRRRHRAWRHRHTQRGRPADRARAGRPNRPGPLLARRDLRCRRGHRHAGQRGLRRSLQVHRRGREARHPAWGHQAERGGRTGAF